MGNDQKLKTKVGTSNTGVHGPVVTTASFRTEQWMEFARNSGLQHVKVCKYYLGGVPAKLTHSQREEVISGLFTDAVAVGALTLPVPYSVEDFKLRIGGANCGTSITGVSKTEQWDDLVGVFFRSKSSPHGELAISVDCYIDRHSVMDNYYTTWFLEKVVQGLNSLLRD